MADMSEARTSNMRDVFLEIDGKIVKFSVDEITYLAVERKDPNVIEQLKRAYISATLQGPAEPYDAADMKVHPFAESNIPEPKSKVNVVPPAVDSNVNKVAETMPRGAVLSLLQLYKENEDRMNDKKTAKKKVWCDIATKMQELGHNYEWHQMKNKFHNMSRNYRQTVDHNNKTGRDPKSCPYFDELEEIFGSKQNTKPDNISDSYDSEDVPVNESSSSHAEQDPFDSLPVMKDKKRKRIQSPKKSKVIKALEIMQKQKEVDNEKLHKELEKQHRELIEIEQEKLNVLRDTEQKKLNLLEKLLDKF